MDHMKKIKIVIDLELSNPIQFDSIVKQIHLNVRKFIRDGNITDQLPNSVEDYHVEIT